MAKAKLKTTENGTVKVKLTMTQGQYIVVMAILGNISAFESTVEATAINDLLDDLVDFNEYFEYQIDQATAKVNISNGFAISFRE